MSYITEEKKMDIQGKLLFLARHGHRGGRNLSQISYYPNHLQATTTFAYDSFLRLVSMQNPIGQIPNWTYDERHQTLLRQKLLQVTKKQDEKTVVMAYNDYGQILSSSK